MKLFLVTLVAILFVLFHISPVNSLPIERRGGSGGTFSGEGTFFTVGLGSCGETSKDSDLVVALSSSKMSSGKYCGKKIKAKGTKGDVTATVVDTCPGCAEDDIDFSIGAFKSIGSMAAGRIKISWEFE
ncbi:RlpA-like double-psi beta-barrel-protein domain-containing protein-containing protein [Circinella umbellata]|nr:RlpA-like double-psi beta-barrel-protein domain-containing protein-containing protein [Circinella umbellata]